MRQSLDISLAAAGRVLIDHHDETLALVACHNGRIRYIVRGEGFPWIDRPNGTQVCGQSETARAFASGAERLSPMTEVAAIAWTRAEVAELFEQVRIGRNGHSLTLLCATLPEDPNED
ncbi:hypothetical protein ROA7023_04188 [Roseisalinus antarcticus]|uniref:Uncharacterized protein n=2 Tax=Roseisalinus antarcticus TaxID=254357 RepID=A0A1Y5TZ74_9RHOB|nr:hypothetical protein ROA7023_04188 [Roseisalinus antarcticus]